MNVKVLAIFSLTGSLASAAIAQTYAAYTFGPSGTLNYVGPEQYGVGFTGTSFRFQAAAGGTVTNIAAAINDYLDEPGQPFTLQLWTDSGNGSGSGLLGTELGSWGATSSGIQYTTTPVSVNVSGGPVLTAGAWYWLTGASTVGSQELGWAEGPYSNPNGYVLEGDSALYDGPETAFSVTVNAVPEPSTWAALALPCLGLIIRRRTRKSS